VQKVRLQLDLYQKKVYIDFDGPGRRVLHDIVGASAAR
jgi:hypothetical protein